MTNPREVKAHWKLKLLKRIKDQKDSIRMQEYLLKELENNLDSFDKQMDFKEAEIKYNLFFWKNKSAHFEEDKEISKLEITNKRNTTTENLERMKLNLKVLENQLKEGVIDEKSKTEKK